jgi:hypothetical protein
MRFMAKPNDQANNRRFRIGFSIAGSLVIILFLVFVNLTTGAQFLWFIFPAYAVLWWPLVTIFIGRNTMKIFSLAGSLITIAFLALTNYLTSWHYPWFLFPAFGVIWWPIAAFWGTRHRKIVSIVGCIVLIAFFIVMNYMMSPSFHWFSYPAFAVIWWPLRQLFSGPKTARGYAMIGSLIIIVYLTLENILRSPFCPWALFTYFPVLMWPVGVMLGKRMARLTTSLICCAVGIIYYTILNMTVFQGFPWAIFPAYALLWWPLAIGFAKQGHSLLFAVSGALLSAVLFVAVNLLTSPNEVWAVYPIFGLIWWPLSIYYFVYSRNKHIAKKDIPV